MAPSAKDSKAAAQARLSDLELARAAATGDVDTQRQLCLRLYDRIRTAVRYLRGDQSNSHDIVQVCLMEVIRSIGTYRGDSRLETWVDRIVVRTAVRQFRKKQKRIQISSDQVAEHLIETEDPESKLSQERLRARVAAMLQKLQPERRTVFVLRSVYGYTMPEIAEMTDTRLHNVQNGYKMARKQLRRLVQADATLREWAQARKS